MPMMPDMQAVLPLFYENPVEGGYDPADDAVILVQPCVRALQDARDAQRWRAVRDEVLRLDQVARPSPSGVVMADDDVEPLVLGVLQRVGQRGVDARSSASGDWDRAHQQAAGRGHSSEYADGHLAGDRDRMRRCREDLARRLRLPPGDHPWAHLLDAVVPEPKLRRYHALLQVLDAAAEAVATFSGSDFMRPQYDTLSRLVCHAQATLAEE